MTREALARLNDELEARVTVRTAQLLTTNQRLEVEVAARWAAEGALREQTQRLALSEERFRLINERMRDIIFHYRLDPTPGFEYISPSVQTILGYTPQHYYSDPALLAKTLHPDDLPLVRAILSDLVRKVRSVLDAT